MGHDLLLFVHFFALAMGGAAAFGLPVTGAMHGAAPDEHKPSVARIVKPLKMIGHTAIALLVVTGVILATMGAAWSTGGVWFWVKLIFVAVLITGIVMGGKAGKAAMTGDAAAADKAKMIGMANIVSLAIILLTASLAFH